MLNVVAPREEEKLDKIAWHQNTADDENFEFRLSGLDPFPITGRRANLKFEQNDDVGVSMIVLPQKQIPLVLKVPVGLSQIRLEGPLILIKKPLYISK
jgi:hypothetical protein